MVTQLPPRFTPSNLHPPSPRGERWRRSRPRVAEPPLRGAPCCSPTNETWRPTSRSTSSRFERRNCSFTSKTASPVRSMRSAHQSLPLRPPPPRCTVGTQSAVLAGFAYNGIIMVAIPEHTNVWLKGAWLVVSVCAMGFEMICLINTSFCVMFGPGLALRGASWPSRSRGARRALSLRAVCVCARVLCCAGPDGSMHAAVDGLMLEYRRGALFYGAGWVPSP